MGDGLQANNESSGPTIVRAGLAAFPYLARLGDWATAAWMLEQSLHVDKSPEALSAALPMAQRVAHATAGTDRDDTGLLAHILLAAGREDEAEALLRTAIDRAVEREDFSTASAASGVLIILLRNSGRSEVALGVIDQKAEFTRRAGHGPWSHLLNQGSRLQILNELGRWNEVLPEVLRLRAHMLTLPDPPAANDWSINVWNVCETLLNMGFLAALQLSQWQVCLDLTDEIARSEAARGASALERAKTSFNDYGPLLRLHRYPEARTLLEACLQTFQRENATPLIGMAYSALADLEDELGQYEAACRFEEASFRFRYTSSNPNDAAISHSNYAVYLARTAAQPRLILGHRLAAVLLWAVAQSGQFASSRAALAAALARLGSEAAAALPGDIAALRATVEQVEGVKFGALLRRFIEDDARATQSLQDIIAKAREAQP